jgi:hypothetical protein
MKLELVKKKLFEGMEIECYVNISREDGDFYMTRKQIGEALEYENMNSFHKVMQRNKEIIGEPVVDILSSTDRKQYETEIYTFNQLFQILRFSKQPKANLFMNWASLTLQELITNRAELKFKKEDDKINYENKIKEIVENAMKEIANPLKSKIDEQGKVIYLMKEQLDSFAFEQPTNKNNIFEFKIGQFIRHEGIDHNYAYHNFYINFENWLGYKLDSKKKKSETVKEYIMNNLLDEMIYFVDGITQCRIVKGSEPFVYDRDRKKYIQGKWIDLGGIFENNIEWEKVKNEFNNECAYCGRTDIPLIQEHVFSKTQMSRINPKAVNLINNIVPTCSDCNGSKDNNEIKEWYPNYQYYDEDRYFKIQKHYKMYNVKESTLDKIKIKIAE